MSRLSNNFPYFTNDKGQYYIPCWDVIEKSDLRGVDEKSAAIITALPYVTVKRGYWREAEGYRVLSLLPAKNFLEVTQHFRKRTECAFEQRSTYSSTQRSIQNQQNCAGQKTANPKSRCGEGALKTQHV